MRPLFVGVIIITLAAIGAISKWPTETKDNTKDNLKIKPKLDILKYVSPEVIERILDKLMTDKVIEEASKAYIEYMELTKDRNKTNN
jgi:hypothetical protein